jgi:hypothetical protein
MGLSSAAIFGIIQAITMYCGIQGPGVGIEASVYLNYFGDKDKSASCFKKMWKCTRHTDEAETMDSRVFNCITDHSDGKLK